MAITGAQRAAKFGRPGQVDKTTVTTPWGIRVVVHLLVADVFLQACEAANQRSAWKPKRIDSYNPRPIRGEDGSDLDEWSLHAWALAWDFFATGPNVSPPGGVWTPQNGVPADFAKCFTDLGFRWGATFGRKDVPHIEWPANPPGPVTSPVPIEEDDMPQFQVYEVDKPHPDSRAAWLVSPGSPAWEIPNESYRDALTSVHGPVKKVSAAAWDAMKNALPVTRG